jgi:hypothetical protein
MKILSRKGSIVLLIVVITFALLQVYSRYMVLRSEPYLFSMHFLMNNSRVQDYVGKPQKIALAAFDSFDVRNTPGAEGTARFTFVVHGANGEGKAFLDLHTEKRNWHMTKAELLLKNGQQRDLLSGKAVPEDLPKKRS